MNNIIQLAYFSYQISKVCKSKNHNILKKIYLVFPVQRHALVTYLAMAIEDEFHGIPLISNSDKLLNCHYSYTDTNVYINLITNSNKNNI